MRIHLHVKFRAFGITWGTYDNTIPLPIQGNAVKAGKLIDERGILLEVLP